MRSRKSVHAAVACAAALVLALLAATASRGEPPAITAKRNEARAVLAQIHKLDARLELAVEVYNAATVKLRRIRAQLKVNRHELAVAQANLKLAEQRLAARLRYLYISPEGDATLELLVGARSLEDLLDRFDTAKRVASMDAQVLNEVRRYRRAVIRQGMILRRARGAQRRLVAERAAAKARIQYGLANRRRLLASIRSEIKRLQAEEAARQARLAAAARANLIAWKLEQQQRLNETVVGVTAEGAGAGGSSVAVAPPSPYAGVVGVALAQLGKPYIWGAAGPSTFDCSGLVTYAYAAFGVSLPHSTYSLWSLGVYVSPAQLEPGDLVFFHGLGHVGIYIGNDQFVHAPHTGAVVKISNLYEGWYAATYIGARRIL